MPKGSDTHLERFRCQSVIKHFGHQPHLPPSQTLLEKTASGYANFLWRLDDFVVVGRGFLCQHHLAISGVHGGCDVFIDLFMTQLGCLFFVGVLPQSAYHGQCPRIGCKKPPHLQTNQAYHLRYNEPRPQFLVFGGLS